jgi:His-Xaa-Ser system protein HxsD
MPLGPAEVYELDLPSVLEDKDGVIVRLQTSVYGIRPIAEAAHRLTRRCTIQIEESDGIVSCRIKSKDPRSGAESIADEFLNEVLDQFLRSKLEEETRDIRNLLLAHAFSNTSIFHPELDQSEPGEDPSDIGLADVQRPAQEVGDSPRDGNRIDGEPRRT